MASTAPDWGLAAMFVLQGHKSGRTAPKLWSCKVWPIPRPEPRRSLRDLLAFLGPLFWARFSGPAFLGHGPVLPGASSACGERFPGLLASFSRQPLRSALPARAGVGLPLTAG